MSRWYLSYKAPGANWLAQGVSTPHPSSSIPLRDHLLFLSFSPIFSSLQYHLHFLFYSPSLVLPLSLLQILTSFCFLPFLSAFILGINTSIPPRDHLLLLSFSPLFSSPLQDHLLFLLYSPSFALSLSLLWIFLPFLKQSWTCIVGRGEVASVCFTPSPVDGLGLVQTPCCCTGNTQIHDTPKCIKLKTKKLSFTTSPADGLGLVPTLCRCTGNTQIHVYT